MGCHRKTLNETINIMKIKCMKFFIYYHLLRHLLYFPLLIKTGNPTIKEIASREKALDNNSLPKASKYKISEAPNVL